MKSATKAMAASVKCMTREEMMRAKAWLETSILAERNPMKRASLRAQLDIVVRASLVAR